MSAKLTVHQRLKLIKRALSGENVTKLCKEAKVSRTVFYRWIKKFKKEHGDLNQAINANERPTLRPQDRLEMIERVKLGEEVASVCKLYKVSRTAFYKWLKRYEEAPEGRKLEALWDLRPKVEKYYRQASEEYEEAVLSAVREYPELSTHKLVWVLPQVGGRPILGNHGVQNVLRRNNLSTFEQRLNYSQAFYKPTFASRFFSIFQTLLIFIGSKEAPQRKAIVIGSFTIGFSLFGAVVVYGLISLVGLISSAPSLAFSIGIILALTALTFGMFFFVYSLKYYITIASILSFSRTLSSEEKEGRSQLHFHDTYSGRVGLKADLTNINLDSKPFVSIHIASYNEKKVIDRLLTAATSMEYENYEVVLVDDSSDPEAITLVNKWKDNPRVKVIQRASRAGFKGGALGVALENTNPKAEFIMVFDSDFIPYPDTITQFLKYFKASVGTLEKSGLEKSNVAAVQGYQWHVLNKSENWITRGVRTEYAGSYVIERSGTELYSGLKQISGSVYIIRKDCLASVGWGTSITEDFELTLRLYAAGYKVVYTPYIQAPAEAVSTIKRLIRQRMRWAEGHSFNIKKYFGKLIFSKNLTYAEKGELLYLSPYYLQAFFFIVGTLSWFLAEVVFQVTLPFWTSTWGWSLVFTNLFALPLMNMVGLFLEESNEKDYLGIFSFVAMTYIIAPFMGYASVKGFLEKQEGPWFRTPKTGKITDVFTPSRFYKFIFGVFGRQVPVASAAAAKFANLITAYSPGQEHIQRLGDDYEEWDEEVQSSNGTIPPPEAKVQNYNSKFKIFLNRILRKLQITNFKFQIDEPRLAIQSAYSTFTNIRPPRRSQNTLIGKIILTSSLVLTLAINQITFMTQYEIDLANFSIKAKTGIPLLAQGGLPQGGPAVAPDPAIEQQINIINQEFTTTSTTDAPTDNSLGIVRYTSGSYDPSPTVYFEAIIKNTSGGTATATLYDAPAAGTGAVAIYQSAVSTTSPGYVRVRSGAITLVNATDYTVRLNTTSGTASILAARIILQQSTTTYVANTETQIELGANETTTSTTNTNLLTNPKIWQYTSSNYDGTVTIYFEATMKTSSANNVNVFLYDKTSSSTVTTLSYNTDTNWTRQRTVSGVTLTSGDEYEVGFYETTSGTASIANAKVIITQVAAGGLQSMELYHDYISYNKTQNSASLGTFSTTSQAQLPRVTHVLQSETATIGSSSYLYIIGGQDTSGTAFYLSTVYKSTLNGVVGDVGTFSTASQAQLPLQRTDHSSTKATIGPSTYIYVLGGSADGAAERTTVYQTTINGTTGDLDAFATTSQSQLPEVRVKMRSVTASIGPSTYIYMIGGCSSSCTAANSRSTVYKATINSSGNISTSFLTTSQAQMPDKSQNLAAVQADIGGSSYVYVLGGIMSTTQRSTLYKGVINATTGDLATLSTTSQVQLPSVIHRLSASVTSIGPSTYLYVAGGTTGTGANDLNAGLSTVYRAIINTTSGDVGIFSTTNQAQIPVRQLEFSQNFATVNGSSYLYMMGGVDSTSAKNNQSTVYKAPLSDDYDSFGFDNLYDPSKWVGGTFTYYHEGTGKTNYIDNATTGNARITPGGLGSLVIGEQRDAGAFATTSQGQLLIKRSQHTTVTSTIGSSTYLYLLGGYDDANAISTVYKATLGGVTGDIGTFATTSQAQSPIKKRQHTAVTYTVGPSTYVYLLGGFDDLTKSTVYKATLGGATGNISAFATTSQGQLLAERRAHTTVTSTIGASTYLYVLGGIHDANTPFSTVYKATLGGATGDVSAFATTSQGQLPEIKVEFSTVTSTIGASTYLYVLGGYDNVAAFSTVYKATLGGATGDVGTFATTSQAQLLEIKRLFTAITSAIGASTYLYVIGGHDTATRSTVYKATLGGATGDVGTFATTSQGQSPEIRREYAPVISAIGASTYLYVIGGVGSGGIFSTVYKATLSNDYTRVRSSSFDPFLPNNTNIRAFSTTAQAQLPGITQFANSVINTFGSSTYVYVIAGVSNLSTVYKGIINSNTGDVVVFSTTNQAQLLDQRERPSSQTKTIGSSTYIYVIGGRDSVDAIQSSVYKATFGTYNGDVGTFATTSQAQLLLGLEGSSTALATLGPSSYLYVIGGEAGADSDQRSTVYKSVVDSGTGDLTAFATTSQSQLQAIGHGDRGSAGTFTLGDSTYLYVIGGATHSSVYKGILNTGNGNLGSFNTTSQAQLPVKLREISSAFITIGSSSYIYVFGGTDGTTLQSSVYKATVSASNGDLGSFNTTTQVQLATTYRAGTSSFFTLGNSSYIYMLGDSDASDVSQSSVYKTALPNFPNQAGEVGTFNTTNQAQSLIARERHSALNATIGASTYLYVLGGGDGSAPRSTVYKSTLDNITGDVGTFATTGQNQLSQHFERHRGELVTIGSSTYIYALGGQEIGTALISTVYKSNVNQSGNLGSFTTTNQAQLPTATYLQGSQVLTIGSSSYLYHIGGCLNAACSSAQSTIYKATIKDDSGTGDAGAFATTSQAQLLAVRNAATTITSTIGASTYIYVLGGSDGTSRSTVYKATLGGATGDISAFATTSQGQLPVIRAWQNTITSTVGASTYVYVLGGFDGNRQSTVYKATLGGATGDISAFATTSQGQLPDGRDSLASVTAIIGASTYIYAIGGGNNTLRQSTVYKATLGGATGDVGEFATTSQGQLPAIRNSLTTVTSTVGASTYIYVLGGSDGTTRSTVYKATLGGATGDVGEFATTSQGQLPVIIRDSTTVTSTVGASTYLYVIGGTSGNRQSTVYKATLGGATGDISAFATTSQGQLLAIRGDLTTVTSTVGSSTYLYVIGGTTDGTSVFSTVYKSTLNHTAVEGDLDTFATTSQAQLPETIDRTGVTNVSVGGTTYLYILGGVSNGGASSRTTVYKAQVSSVGDVQAFSTTNQGQLLQTMNAHVALAAAVGSSTYVYVVGGNSVSTVYRAIVSSSNGDIGVFTTTNLAQLPGIRQNTSANIATIGSSSYMYVLGGTTGTTTQSTVYKSMLTADGNNLDTEIQNADLNASWTIINVTSLAIPENLLGLLPLGLVLPHLVRKYKEWKGRRKLKV